VLIVLFFLKTIDLELAPVTFYVDGRSLRISLVLRTTFEANFVREVLVL